MVRLFHLRYFSRVWVIQEVALAKATFLIINDDSILLSATVLRRLWNYCLQRELNVPAALRWVPGDKQLTDIVPWLGCAMECECADPRDRVYAVGTSTFWFT
jgi:hypothetical protein